EGVARVGQRVVGDLTARVDHDRRGGGGNRRGAADDGKGGGGGGGGAQGGRIVVPIAVKQTIDKGLSGPGGPDMSYVAWMCLVCTLGILVTAGASYLTTVRLAINSEHGLATMRIKAFRHVHDLPVLTQSTERR